MIAVPVKAVAIKVYEHVVADPAITYMVQLDLVIEVDYVVLMLTNKHYPVVSITFTKTINVDLPVRYETHASLIVNYDSYVNAD